MFCVKCGELIPDNFEKCPNCGAIINEVDELAVVFASQKGSEGDGDGAVAYTHNKSLFVVIGLAVASFVFLALNYMNISIYLLYYGTSDSHYTGYYLMKCLGGTARLSGIMVIILIILNVATIVTAVVGIKT